MHKTFEKQSPGTNVLRPGCTSESNWIFVEILMLGTSAQTELIRLPGWSGGGRRDVFLCFYFLEAAPGNSNAQLE